MMLSVIRDLLGLTLQVKGGCSFQSSIKAPQVTPEVDQVLQACR